MGWTAASPQTVSVVLVFRVGKENSVSIVEMALQKGRMRPCHNNGSSCRYTDTRPQNGVTVEWQMAVAMMPRR